MISSPLRALLLICCVGIIGCAGQSIPYEPDVVDVILPVPAEHVRTAVIQVLTDDGYDVNRDDEEHLNTGYRKEMAGPWDWLLRWRVGTGKSRVEASVTPAGEQSARLRLNVLYQGKDGIFTRWDASPTALPQSAENELRLIKNALHLL